MKRLNNCKWFVLGIAVCLVCVTMVVPAIAASITKKNAQLEYSGMKISLNGNAVTPKDANGNVVDPFVIDGTTYLPVRAIGTALGMGVDWDRDTNTVKLTGNSASNNAWSKYNSAYPFLFLQAAANKLQSVYGLIVDYRNVAYLEYGYVINGQVSSADYASYHNAINVAIDRMYSVLAKQSEYIDSLQGTCSDADFQSLQKKAKNGYDNLNSAVFQLECMARAVEDCKNGKSGTAQAIDAADKSVGDYLTAALTDIENVSDNSLDYMIGTLPSGK